MTFVWLRLQAGAVGLHDRGGFGLRSGRKPAACVLRTLQLRT
jgi:hypothetical protein